MKVTNPKAGEAKKKEIKIKDRQERVYGVP